mmetsp:Transcript_10500/g.7832  ORF Transcript_10500/g.7832 Transcript_10500/m.7832 type:complete len:140 (-) Transcript_10500:421-840(-)
MRARRVKCGSPLGRIIDEGLDLLAYVFIGVLFAYACRFNPLVLNLALGYQNAAFYSMELKHLLGGELVMKLGEFGNVEAEMLYTIVMASIAIFSPEKTQSTVGSLFGEAYRGALYGMKVSDFLAGLQIVAQAIMILEFV